MIFEIVLKVWRSKSWISTQIQDWAQIMVFEMVYLLLRTVFEIIIIIRGTQIAKRRALTTRWIPHLPPLDAKYGKASEVIPIVQCASCAQ